MTKPEMVIGITKTRTNKEQGWENVCIESSADSSSSGSEKKESGDEEFQQRKQQRYFNTESETDK